MNTIQELDSYTAEYGKRNVVAAGAGTGKTYNIQNIVLKKILDGLAIEQILVVTFTNLATNELQNRLRKILQSALEICDILIAEKNLDAEKESLKRNSQVLPFFGIKAVDEKYVFDGKLSSEILKQYKANLNRALRDFDSAPISTIHGFCSRVLQDNAFESKIRYGMEMRESCDALLKSLFADYCRERCAHSTIRRQMLFRLLDFTPDMLKEKLKEAFANQGTSVNWGIDGNEKMEEIENSHQWTEFYNEIQNMTHEEIEELKTKSYGLFKVGVTRLWTCQNIDFIKSIGSDYWLLYAWEFIKELNSILAADKSPQNVINIISRIDKSGKKIESAVELIRSNTPLRAFLELGRALPDELGSTVKVGLCTLLDQYREIVHKDAYEYVRLELEKSKAREGFLTFDDLLLQLKERLASKDGQKLIEALEEKYKCVLIDECQDTDANQNEIFHRLFDGGEGRTLFMIGDVKQAIYKFRGGDVQTFLDEQNKSDKKFTLTRNFRSSGDFIASMNDFWNSHQGFFTLKDCPDDKQHDISDDDIPVEEIKVGKDECHVEMDNVPLTGNCLLSIGNVENGESLYQKVADEIQWLVSDNVKIVENTSGNKKEIKYSDIAVLVRSKTHVDEMRKVFRQNGIPSVFMQGQSVFKSDECRIVLSMLDAVLEPGNQSKALGLLSSPLFGFSASALELVREYCLPDFQMFLKEMNEKWLKKSFYFMFNEFIGTGIERMMPSISKVHEALAKIIDGEAVSDFADKFVFPLEELNCLKDEFAQLIAVNQDKSNTDKHDKKVGITPVMRLIATVNEGDRSLAILIQLAEKLMSIATEKHLGQMGLFSFLNDKRRANMHKDSVWKKDDWHNKSVDEDDNDDEMFPVHLTTEAEAVRILTIHKSKGLEFPFVFVPQFSKTRSMHVSQIYHDGGKNRIVNLSNDESIAELCEEEEAKEARRLMYVAITRAKYLCRFISRTPAKQDFVKYPEFLLPNVDNLGSGNGRSVPDNPEVVVDTFECKPEYLASGWEITSFSSISKTRIPRDDDKSADGMLDDNGGENTDDGARGEFIPYMKPYDEREAIFRFPGGTRTGTCWHGIFEKLDFSRWGNAVSEKEREDDWKWIEAELENSGMLTHNEAERNMRIVAFRNMLDNVCNFPLQFEGEQIRLCSVARQLTLREFNFTYQIKGMIDNATLRNFLDEEGIKYPSEWERGISQPLTGSIDLLFQNGDNGKFYIIDWKTNLIGADKEKFTPEGVNHEMEEHFYKLQCIIYTLAFVQYFRQFKHAGDLVGLAGAELQAALEKFRMEAYDCFGGCADIFVRGIDAERGWGVHYIKPSYKIISQLDDTIGVRF